MALEDKNLPETPDVDPELAATIREYLVDDKLPCAQAFKVADLFGISAEAVGEAADALRIRLSRCQLGLFGYPDKQGWAAAKIDAHPVPEGLEPAIRQATDASGYLTCVKAWGLADRFDIPRMQVGYVADQLGIRIVSCQLGAF